MPLYILPFDHRSMFLKNIFSWKYPINKRQQATIESYKKIIFQGFVKAREEYIKRGKNEDLVFFIDEEFGKSIVKEAKQKHIQFSLALEKSGTSGFVLEYGNDYKNHLKKLRPAFAKALVHYQSGMGDLGTHSKHRLKEAITYCRKNSIATVVEIVLSPLKGITSREALHAFDRFARPRLTVKIIRELTRAGITPTVWKLEPQPSSLAWKKVIRAVNNIPIVVLGAGRSMQETQESLKISASFPEIIGFAIGRTVFQDPLIQYRQNMITRRQAIARIAETFSGLVRFWEGEKGKNKGI